jgi:predicted unusual protein kinase regulating ubiquinone biosynthesis (AarF/ABC1/UbiB family)
MYKFPFSLPPFYIAIIRCLGVLEGLAIQVDDEFKIISDAYPYIASRLLTDPSLELQAALEQLLFKDGQPRWERLQSLLEEAGTTSDYDVTEAIDQLLAYIVSDRGKSVRDIMAVQLVEILDTLGADMYVYTYM